MKRWIQVVGPIVLLLLVLLAPNAEAVPISEFSAIPPTQYTDGTMILSTDVLTYRIYCGNASGAYFFSYDTPTIAPGTQIDITTCVQGTPGTYFFAATAISAIFASESVFSNEATRTYSQTDLPKTPLAPTIFTVQ